MMRMNIASFSRYAIISKAAKMSEEQFSILFFTACEELDGANMLARLSFDYETIKPLLKKID